MRAFANRLRDGAEQRPGGPVGAAPKKGKQRRTSRGGLAEVSSAYSNKHQSDTNKRPGARPGHPKVEHHHSEERGTNEVGDGALPSNPILHSSAISSPELHRSSGSMSHPQPQQFEPKDVLDFTIDLAKQAGEVIRQGRQELQDEIAKDHNSIIKKNSSDLVTKTDQGTEAFCQQAIAKRYPDWKIIGEESWAAVQQSQLDNTPTFIIDPIDGTTK